MQFFFQNVSDVSAERLHDWFSNMTAEKRQGMDRMPEITRLEHICADGMIRDFLAQRLGIHAKDVHFSYGDHGKPACPQSDIHFNVSHSDGLVLLGISQFPIGVDVEKIRCVKPSIMRAFSDEERKYLNSLDDQRIREQELFTLWTLHEAIIKCDGSSIAKFSDMSVSMNGGVPRYKKVGYTCGILDAPDGYRAAYCEKTL